MTEDRDKWRKYVHSVANHLAGLPMEESIRMTRGQRKMEKVHPSYGQTSNRGRLKNGTEPVKKLVYVDIYKQRTLANDIPIILKYPR